MRHIIPILEYLAEVDVDTFISDINEISYILKDIDVQVTTLVQGNLINIKFSDLKNQGNREYQESDEMYEFIDRMCSLCDKSGYKPLNKHRMNESIRICKKSVFSQIYKDSWDRLLNSICKYDKLLEKDGLYFRIECDFTEKSGSRLQRPLRYSFFGLNTLKSMSYSQGLREFEKKVAPICDKLGFVLFIPRSEPNPNPNSASTKMGASPNDDLVSSSLFSIYRKDYWDTIIKNKDTKDVFLVNYGKYVDRIPGYIENWGPYEKKQEDLARKNRGFSPKI